MYSKIFSAALFGMEAQIVNVEADVCDGLPLFSMVGYLGSEVKEARERVKIALKNFGLRMPPKHITINLSPADMRKEGTVFDLAVAVSILAAFCMIPKEEQQNTVFVGELSLEGKICAVSGVLPIVNRAKKEGFTRCIVPYANAREGAVVAGITVIGVTDLLEVSDFLNGRRKISPCCVDTESLFEQKDLGSEVDLCDISGQKALKRALLIAVSGMHHILISGPPGVGKTMAAKCIPGIMPDLSFEESMEITKVYSISGLLSEGNYLVNKRPFRAPHHSVSPKALIGGGRKPRAGEVSLASGGVLFLDELTEFSKNTLELLRQPLEEKKVTITRVFGSFDYPADFMLVAAMNPCRCGYFPDRNRCQCTMQDIKRYLDRLSGPFLDRMDLFVQAVSLNYQSLKNRKEEEDSYSIRQKVKQARILQKKRYKGETIFFNSGLKASMLDNYCPMGKEAEELMEYAFTGEPFSARAYHRLIKVARTIADVEGSEEILPEHISESICYRFNGNKWMQ